MVKLLIIAILVIAPHVIRQIFRYMLKEKLYGQSLYSSEYEAVVNKIFALDVLLILIITLQSLTVTIILTRW